MPERSTIFQGIQIAKETTPGTFVAANKRLQSISIEPSIKIETNDFKPIGTKMTTIVQTGKEWSEAGISGMLDFNEIAYLASSVLTTATPTGTTERTWVFSPSATSADAPVTFTVEQGDAVRAHRIAHGLVTELGFDFSRDEITIDGAMMGQRLTDGITMTASPTSAVQAIASPAKLDFYLDTTSAGLGTTKLTRAMSMSWKLSDRFGPGWFVNSANTSFATFVETEPKLEVSLMVEADAAGMAFLTDLRANTTKFVRVEVTGDVITTNPYRFTLDTAVKWTDISDFSDEDGIYAVEFTGTAVFDATWNKFMNLTLINTLASL